MILTIHCTLLLLAFIIAVISLRVRSDVTLRDMGALLFISAIPLLNLVLLVQSIEELTAEYQFLEKVILKKRK